MKKIKMALSTTTVILLFLIVLPAYAKSPKMTGYNTGTVTVDKSYNYRTVILDESLNPTKAHKSKVLKLSYKVYIDYIFKWEMSTLMGEPVVVGWLAYKPTAILPHISTPLAVSTLNNNELFKKVRVSEFKMRAWFFKNNRLHGAAREFDTGVAWKPFLGYSIDELMNNEDLYKKYSSYNVSGSPDWNELFYNIKDSHQAKTFFTDFTATKTHIKSRPSDYRIVKVDIDTSEVDKYIYKYLQQLEEEIVREKTTPLIAEKTQLESKVQKEKDHAESLEKEAKASYAAKSFEDQMDDLLGELEDDEAGEAEYTLKNVNTDDVRINFLDIEIKKTTIPLSNYSNENFANISSNFEARKSQIAKKMPARYPKIEYLSDTSKYPDLYGLRMSETGETLIDAKYTKIFCKYGRCFALGSLSSTAYLLDYNGNVINTYHLECSPFSDSDFIFYDLNNYYGINNKYASFHEKYRGYSYTLTLGDQGTAVIELATGKILIRVDDYQATIHNNLLVSAEHKSYNHKYKIRSFQPFLFNLETGKKIILGDIVKTYGYESHIRCSFHKDKIHVVGGKVDLFFDAITGKLIK